MPLRHSLVWLDAEGWRAVLAQTPACFHADVIRWGEADWPLTVRRQDAGCSSDQLCLGVALPPLLNGDKIRLPFRVAQSVIIRSRPPLLLSHIAPGLPQRWRDAAIRLYEAAQQSGNSVQVFGSAAMQSITGLAYLHAASDLDLLLQPSTLQQLADCVQLFRTFDQQLPLDGEIIFGATVAVALREWCNAADQEGGFRVLVKQAAGVALMQKDALISLLECPTCMPT